MNLKMGSSVAREIRKKVGDKRVAQMLDHFVQYVGSSPYGSPAVLCSIAHMQTQEAASGIRWAAPAPCRWRCSGLLGNWAWRCALGVGVARILSQRRPRHGRADRGRRDRRALCGRLQHG